MDAPLARQSPFLTRGTQVYGWVIVSVILLFGFNLLLAEGVGRAKSQAIEMASILSHQADNIENARHAVSQVMRSIDLDIVSQEFTRKLSLKISELIDDIETSSSALSTFVEAQAAATNPFFSAEDILASTEHHLLDELEILRQRTEELRRTRPDELSWRFSIWAPLSVTLAPMGPLTQALQQTSAALFQSTAQLSSRASRLQYGVFIASLSIVLILLFSVIRPMSKRLEQERRNVLELVAKLSDQANEDVLSKLGNRRKFESTIAQVLQRHSEGQYALILLDFDNFKSINDVYGHSAGDAVIVAAADRLRKYVSSNCEAFRLGGDEFAIVWLESPEHPLRLNNFCVGLTNVLGQSVQFNARRVSISLSIGAVLLPRMRELTLSALLTEAGLALQRAKHRKPNNIQIVDLNAQRSHDDGSQLLRALHAALNSGKIVANYQPITRSDGSWVGFESLARWDEDGYRGVQPGKFVPMLEQIEQVGLLTQLALDRAWDFYQRLERQFSGLYISVNFSHGFLLDELAVKRLCERYPSRGLSWLQCEVVESVFFHRNYETIVANLRRLSEAGCKIALDDFGTGYGTLTHLKQFPCDRIKIDKSFV
ncbi:MAG: diguanylate cyclase, partial [Gammaproteobacteria bacterium]|nr:diguanylate cyclase [Gammaproteobacteria bacterium]